MRIKLVKLSSCEYAVLLTVHHIISDGWSMGVLVKKWRLSIEPIALVSSPLPELASNAADYAVWQRGWLQGVVLKNTCIIGASGWPVRRPYCSCRWIDHATAIQRFQGRTVSLLVEAR